MSTKGTVHLDGRYDTKDFRFFVITTRAPCVLKATKQSGPRYDRSVGIWMCWLLVNVSMRRLTRRSSGNGQLLLLASRAKEKECVQASDEWKAKADGKDSQIATLEQQLDKAQSELHLSKQKLKRSTAVAGAAVVGGAAASAAVAASMPDDGMGAEESMASMVTSEDGCSIRAISDARHVALGGSNLQR